MIDVYNRKYNFLYILVALILFIFIYLVLFVDPAIAQNPPTPNADPKASSGSWTDWFSGFLSPVDFALYAILVLMGWIVNLGAILLGTIVDAKIFHEIFAGPSSETLKSGWYFVRDFFNIFFILILLFSAFATIFQVEKFHLKRTLLMIVLMALLVNFSWPITLLIIDFSNVIMYFFLENLFTNPSGAGFASSISSESGIARLIVPVDFKTANDANNAATDLMFRIIFMFLYAITIVTIGAIFLLRLVMLAILIIFAPIGFVAAILPSTQKYASMWWDNLFKWAFIGPIMIFMLALSLNLMKAFNKSAGTRATELSLSQSYSVDIGGMMAVAVQMTAAIAILWAGIIVAGKMGGSGGSMITGYANRAAKWGGKMATRGTVATTKFAGQKTGRGVANKLGVAGLGTTIASRRNQRKAIKESEHQQRVAAQKERGYGLANHKIGATEGAATDAVAKAAADYKEKKITTGQLKQMAHKGDAAAVMRLAEDNTLDGNDYKNFRMSNSDAANNKGVQNMLNKKVSERNAHAIIIADISTEQKRTGAPLSQKDKQTIVSNNLGNMSADQLAKQNVALHSNNDVRMYLSGQSNKFLEETGKRLSNDSREAWRVSGDPKLSNKV